MKNRLSFTAGVLAALVGMAASTQANPITGSINMTGNATVSGDLGTAGTVSLSSPALVTSASGAYGGIPVGTPVAFTPFLAWNPASTPITMWQVHYGVWNYAFEATSLSVLSQNSTDLELQGGGIATITGIGSPNLATLATWSLSIKQSNTGGYTYHFHDPLLPGPQGVPDGGTTAVLLGAALSGLVIIRKRLLA